MKNNSKGFTLIELLIYISIFVILISSLTVFAISFTEMNARSRIKKEISLATYSAMRAMIYEMKRANAVYMPTSRFDVHPGQLSLETDYNLPTDEKTTYLDFYLDNDNRLYLKKEEEKPQLLIPKEFKVTNLEFRRTASSSDSLLINLTLEYDVPLTEYQYTYSLQSSGTIRK